MSLRWPLLLACVGLLSVPLLWSCSATALATPPSAAPDGFWDHWGDGRAEVAGYRLRIPRYGQVRQGEATLIFVTEDMTHGQRVKTDGGHEDVYPVLKLNQLLSFQTGIYDYSSMTSSFVRLDGGQDLGLATKVSGSVQEWCGHTWEQLLVDDESMRWTLHSYFDGEGEQQQRLPVPAGAVMEDVLPMVVRGLAGALVAPGASVEVPWLPATLEHRLRHRQPAWGRATITRSAGPETVEVPAGSFQAERFDIAVAGGQTARLWVGVEGSRPLLRWTRSDGFELSLLGVSREPYWRQSGEGQEVLRERLGLTPPRWP